MIRACIFLALLSISFADNVNYKDCGSVSGKIEAVDINPCPTEPCELKRNTNITISLDFMSNSNSATFKTIVHGIIGGVPVPFPSSNGKITPPLPIKPDQKITYTNAIFVEPTYPKISLLVKWEIWDASRKDFVCFVVPAEIVA
ncbi:NPC intracellular cholesterol transporter 2-like [Ostrea edulis]|uniref:NPC intracellular cholesterol transporter 2-like n=1 Tax=Ostrea edulis TaxID=37623 RepID=UPI0020964D03|nr:NPC intracellular cholesterol transporter 2-like [Ostrea edulis]